MHVLLTVSFTFPAVKSNLSKALLLLTATTTNTHHHHHHHHQLLSYALLSDLSEKFLDLTEKERAVSNLMATTMTTEKQVMVVAIDEREHTFYALQWTLDNFFTPFGPNPPYKLVLVHAKPTPSSVVGFIGPGAAEVLPIIESDLKKIAAATIEKAKEICSSKSVNDVVVEVVEGDARNVICDAVEKYHATILVVGSHGYGVIKRAVLGSVSDYCAHHAHCTVMIVKKPKTKH